VSTFAESLAVGQVGESKIANYLKARLGVSILPVYETEIGSGKGPRLFAVDRDIIAPDMLCFPSKGSIFWVEAKHKTVWTWYRKNQSWQTGIDSKHYGDYLEVRKRYGYILMLAFLHSCGTPHPRDIDGGSPSVCPTGLFAEELNVLRYCIDHEGHEWAKGMIYWNRKDLRLVATLEEVERANRKDISNGFPPTAT